MTERTWTTARLIAGQDLQPGDIAIIVSPLTNGIGGGRKPSRELLLLSRGQGAKYMTWRVQDTQTLAIFERKFAHHLGKTNVIRKPGGMQMVKIAAERNLVAYGREEF